MSIMKLYISILLLVFTTNIFAQKADKSERSDSDFTTTPFQDGSQAKGLKHIVEGFYFVEDASYEESGVVINMATSFNPNKSKFSIDGKVMVLKMTIYDMQGEKLYEGKMKNDWNGKNNAGEKVESGLYIYAIEARITPDRTSKIAGFIRVEKE